MKTLESIIPGRFHSFEGDLYLAAIGETKPVRVNFDRCHREIKSGQDLRATLRHGDYTFPGCYPLYFVTSDGAALSFGSVRENLRAVLWSIRHKANDGWQVIGCNVNYEDGELVCEHSGERIPSAYAEA